jgi:transketolase C-terminal domain/subunit
MTSALEGTDPVVFFESQRVYGFGEEFRKDGVPEGHFEIPFGEPDIKREGKDLTILTIGAALYRAMEAAKILEEKYGISAEVIDIATIKPLDVEAVVASAKKTGAVVCAEEHNMCGGLGELIAGVLASHAPTPVEYINGGDKFGQSGTPAQLLKAYDMDAEHIAEAAKKAIGRK